VSDATKVGNKVESCCGRECLFLFIAERIWSVVGNCRVVCYECQAVLPRLWYFPTTIK